MRRGVCCECGKSAKNNISYFCDECLEKEVVTKAGGGMIDLTEKQRQRAVTDRKTFLINELNKLDIFLYRQKPLQNYDLVTLENIHINEKCRLAESI